MEKNVALLVAHFLNDRILKKYYSIDSSFDGDLVLLLHIEREAEWNIPNDVNCIPFSISSLNKLSYKSLHKTILPGSNHFALLWFYKHHPYYDYYWNIEYDVEFSGSWKILFDNFSVIDADFISCHIQNYNNDTSWYWWNYFKCNENISLEKRIRSFNPIYRISKDALSFLDIFLKQGNIGHHEVLIPTILNLYKYKLLDFGGEGKFILPENKNKYYLSSDTICDGFDRNLIVGGTMRYRPEFDYEILDIVKDKLIHPLK